MDLLDVNVLLAAHRADHPLHVSVRSWFDGLVGGEEPFTVPTVVWHAFLRLATNRRIFPAPTPREQAFAFLHAVTEQPHHLLTAPSTRHLAVLERLCAEAAAVGDLVPDAVIAAVAVEHNCRVVTLDRDFARFPTVRHLLLVAA